MVQLLRDALERHPSEVKIEVCAILNDTTGCLMSCAWKEEKCRIGLIIGTGTNACYLEEVKDIHTLDGIQFILNADNLLQSLFKVLKCSTFFLLFSFSPFLLFSFPPFFLSSFPAALSLPPFIGMKVRTRGSIVMLNCACSWE